MRLRSLLFVPGDSEKKFNKAIGVGADVLILDLEDSVAPSAKADARARVSGWLGQADHIPSKLFVRVNPLGTGMMLTDLAAVVGAGLAGLLIPKANGAYDIERIGHYLDALEEQAGLSIGTVKLMVIATETPTAMFNLGSYLPPHPRLVGLTWGAEDLASAIGAIDNKDGTGAWTFPYQLARSQCLFAAAAAGFSPIETLYADFNDPDGLEEDCNRARRDGFIGRIAIHPYQVEIINQCFMPSETEILTARRIIDAFATSPDAGTVGIDGKMYDIPHLNGARKIVEAAGEKV